MMDYEISFEDIKPVIDEAYDNGLFSVSLTGGECTTAKDFLKIAKYVREKRINLIILTNGINLYDNEELFNEVVNLYPEKVSFTVFSLNPEIHDKITGMKGSLHKTLSVIQKLSALKIHTEIKHFITQYNCNEFSQLEKWIRENNVNFFLFDDKFYNNPENNNSHVAVKSEQLEKIYRSYTEITGNNFPKQFDLSDKAVFENPICIAGQSKITVNPNLDVVICHFYEKKLGNLKTNSIMDIWHERTCDCQELTNYRKLKLKDMKDCYKEKYCEYCFSCPGFAGENFGKSEYLCERAKIIYKVNLENEAKKALK